MGLGMGAAKRAQGEIREVCGVEDDPGKSLLPIMRASEWAPFTHKSRSGCKNPRLLGPKELETTVEKLFLL